MHAMDLRRRITAQALAALILLVANAARADDCEALRARLDAGVTLDPRHARSRLEPWLRRDAFLAAELAKALADREPERRRTLLEAMASLELDALALRADASEQGARRAATCASAAVAAVAASPARLEALAAEPLPPVYRRWARRIGAYAVARPFLRAGAARWRAHERAAIAGGSPSTSVLYRPEVGAREAPVDLAALLQTLRARHPLAWPVPDGAALARLGAAFAPELATTDGRTSARIGALEGRAGRPAVDTASPRGYLDHGLVRWGDHVLLQLSYTFWYPERPKTWPLDPYGGNVDGLVLRVTVADDGRALLWESIHPCGCFYTLVLPDDRKLRFLEPDPGRLEPPLMLEGPAAAARPRLHYTADAHYLRAVTAASEAPSETAATAYTLTPHASLLAAGPRRAPFDEQGLLRGSERGERLFLWPSGIPSPGAMRTPGRQATAFLGVRRFEAGVLLDGRLRIPPLD